MTSDEATALLAAALHQVAPEVDLAAVDPDLPLQEATGMDSMDFLNLVTAIHDRTGNEIPFRDYPRLSTLKLFVSYLMSVSGAA
jgi:acyl carrier protein